MVPVAWSRKGSALKSYHHECALSYVEIRLDIHHNSSNAHNTPHHTKLVLTTFSLRSHYILTGRQKVLGRFKVLDVLAHSGSRAVHTTFR